MDTIIAFSAGFLLSWPSLIVLLLLGVLAEHNDSRGWAVFFGIVLATISYFYFELVLLDMLMWSAAYFIVGIFWSFWRYRRHMTRTVARLRSEYDDLIIINRALQRHTPGNMKGTITAWVIIWPLSFIGSMSGDLIDVVQAFISTFFKGVYHRIYSVSVADVSRLDDGI